MSDIDSLKQQLKVALDTLLKVESKLADLENCKKNENVKSEEDSPQSFNLFSSVNVSEEIQRSREDRNVSKLSEIRHSDEHNQDTNHNPQLMQAENDKAIAPIVPAEAIEIEIEIPCERVDTNFNDATENDNSFEKSFDEYFTQFLQISPSDFVESEIIKFSETIPNDFVVSEDRFPTLFEALFKIKKIADKCIFDQSLLMIKKLFEKVNYNKFLLQFWQSDEFKNRLTGPIGYSYTQGTAVYDFTGTLPQHYTNTEKFAEKVLSAAWSMLLDIEATVSLLLDTICTNKLYANFYQAIFREFRCLGEFVVKDGSSEVPIFVLFFRKLYAETKNINFNLGLTCFVNICKSSKDKNGSTLMKPRIVLQELLDQISRDNKRKPLFITALRRLFSPLLNFDCTVEWNCDSIGYDNPVAFLKAITKSCNRYQEICVNDDIFFIVKQFKTSLKDTNLTCFKNVEIQGDFPFVFKICDLLQIRQIRLDLPASIFEILPESEKENYVCMKEEKASFEKAVKALFEIHFIGCNTPDSFTKNLSNIFPQSTKEVYDYFSHSIIEVANDLKMSTNIILNNETGEFILKLYGSCFTQDFLRSMSFASGMSFDFIASHSHLIVFGRAIREMIQKPFFIEQNRIPFNSLKPMCHRLLEILWEMLRQIFETLNRQTFGSFHPWRVGKSKCYGNDISMSINYLLDIVFKDMLLVMYQTTEPSATFNRIIAELEKQRNKYGIYVHATEKNPPTWYEKQPQYDYRN